MTEDTEPDELTEYTEPFEFSIRNPDNAGKTVLLRETVDRLEKAIDNIGDASKVVIEVKITTTPKRKLLVYR